MLFDILIMVALLALTVSNIYLVSRKQKPTNSDDSWLSLRLAVKDLEKQFKSVDERFMNHVTELDARLGVQSSVVGDIRWQMMHLEEGFSKRLEDLSENIILKAEKYEKQLSDAYRKHDEAIQKLSHETWSALNETREQLHSASKGHERLEKSLNGFRVEYRQRVTEFQRLIDTNHQSFKEASHDLHSSIESLSHDLTNARNRFEKDIQVNQTQTKQLSKSIDELSESIGSKLASQNVETKQLVEETRRHFEQSLAEDYAKLENQTSREIKALDSRFSDQIESVDSRLESNVKGMGESLGKEIKQLDSRFSDQIESVDSRLESNVKSMGESLGNEIKQLDSRVEKTASNWSDQISKIAKEIDKELIQLAQNNDRFVSEQKEQNDRIVSIQNELIQVKETEQTFTKHVQRQNQITRNIENLVNGSNAFNYNTFKAFDRRFVRKDYEESLKPILDYFGLSISFNTVGYLAHKICKIEENCVGRLATNIQDALIRLLCVFGLKRKKAKILEIGTLFGINLCIVEELSSAYGKDLSYQVIDPLDGYYKSGQLDIVTKQKVNSRNFWFNIRKCGLEAEKFDLIEGFSHHKRIVNQVQDSSIDLAYIDGDHTKKGVALDIRNYNKKLRKGGLFLFDDYGSDQWPEVQEAVDASRIIKSKYKFVGRAFRTAIYSKK